MGSAGEQQGIQCSESIGNIRSILSEAKQRYPVLMIGPPPCGDPDQEKSNEILSTLSQQFAEVCNELEVPCLDVFAALVHSPVWLTEAKANDGAHPRAAGYAEFAQVVQQWEGWLNWFTP